MSIYRFISVVVQLDVVLPRETSNQNASTFPKKTGVARAFVRFRSKIRFTGGISHLPLHHRR